MALVSLYYHKGHHFPIGATSWCCPYCIAQTFSRAELVSIMADEFQQKSAAFLAWFKSRCTNLSPKINLADLRCRNAGRGLGPYLILLTLSICLLVWLPTLLSVSYSHKPFLVTTSEYTPLSAFVHMVNSHLLSSRNSRHQRR